MSLVYLFILTLTRVNIELRISCMCQVDVVHRAFHQEPLDDGVDADDSSTEGDEGVSPKEVIRSFQLKKISISPK